MTIDLRQSPETQTLLRQRGATIVELAEKQVGYIFRFKPLPILSVIVIPGVSDPQVLDQADLAAKKYRAIGIQISPRVPAGSHLALQWETALIADGFVARNLGIAPTKTIILDLTQTDDQLLQDMKQKTRYNIRLAQKRGVKTEIICGDCLLQQPGKLASFHDLLTQNFIRLNTKPISKEALLKHIQVYNQHFIAMFAYLPSGELGAVTTWFLTDDTIWYSWNGSSLEGRRNFAPSLLVWEGIQEGKRQNDLWLDFDGIQDERYGEEDWQGFSRFKAGFGGQTVTYLGSYGKRWALLR